MEEVLIKSLGFIFIILLGYVLKRSGFFKAEDGIFFSKIIMNITLPAALIASSNGMNINAITLSLIMLGFLSNIFATLLAKFLSLKEAPIDRALKMLNCAGYNIGNFAIPFASSFFGATGLIYMCMFDIGNALMNLGGTNAIARNEVDGRGRLKLIPLLRALTKSIPFDVYILLFFLSLFSIKIPAPVTMIASMIGSGNSFLAMLMIGIILEINIDKKQSKAVFKILAMRYIANIIFAFIIFFILPIPLLAKQMVILILFSPISTMSAVYSRLLAPEEPTPAIANSISIIVSIFVMTGLLLLFV